MSSRNSYWAMLGQDISSSPETFERVRQAMLGLLQEHGADNAELHHKLTYATDIDALWYLRSNLMAAIATYQSDEVARACITQVTFLFQDQPLGGEPRED